MKKNLAIISSIALLALPLVAAASISTTLNTLSDNIFAIAAAAAALMITIGGIRFIMAGGSPEQITGAKNMIIYALVGLLIAGLAYTIVKLIP